MRALSRLLVFLPIIAVSACALSPSVQAPAPEAASGWDDKSGWRAQRWMVAAANPHAVEAGTRMLDAGGSAVDAAIAVQMVLTLVEPQSSGIGGGAFLMHWDGRSVRAYDGRETAPMAADESLFIEDGRPLAFHDAVVGGRSVGTPGVLRLLEMAHRHHGKLPWSSLFVPAIRLAEEGFEVSPRLASLLAGDAHLSKDPAARALYFDTDGKPLPAGARLRNPALAETLRAIASGGADVFYRGPIARDIVGAVGRSPNPGRLSEADLEAYAVRERDALCFPYRAVHICGMPPPSSGTLALAQIFTMLEDSGIERHLPRRGDHSGEVAGWQPAAEGVHLYAEAARLAFADRNQYIADPDFINVPVTGLLDRDYLGQRAKLIGPRSIGSAQPGVPPGAPVAASTDATPELPATSHISVVDAAGNAVSMTTTIEDAFGSRRMVRGFLLNNQLTDFSFVARDGAGRPVANRLQPGKRPRSSMSPLLVFERDGGRLLMSLGSPGGSAIINYVGKTLVGTLDWGLNLQEAIALPNFGSRNGPTELEAGIASPALAEALRARGHEVKLMPQTSGLQGIVRDGNGWFGAADPRREGVARGK